MSKSDPFAVALLVVAVGLFSVPLLAGRFVDLSVSFMQLQCLWNGAAFLILLLLLLFGHKLENWRIWQRYPWLVSIRSLVGTLGGGLVIYGLARMPVADAMAISLLEGVTAVMFGAFFLRERLSAANLLIVFIAFLGGLIVVLGRDGGPEVQRANLLPAAMVFLGAMLMAVETILLRMVALRSTPVPALMAVTLAASVGMGVPAIPVWEPMPLSDWIWVVSMGPLVLLGQYFNMVGYRRVPVSIAAPLGYTALPFGALIGFVGYGEVPATATILGGAIIIGTGMILMQMRVSNPSPAPAAARRR